MNDAELVEAIYALEERDRVDVDIAGAGRPMALVVDVSEDENADGTTVTHAVQMRTLAKRTITAEVRHLTDEDEHEWVGALIDGPKMAETEGIEIESLTESAQKTLAEAVADVDDPEEDWPPDTLDLYCKRCGGVHEHERTTSEKTGRTAWKCREYNILNDPEQPRLGVAYTGGDGA